ncbi:MAG: hypothetical protein EOO73_19435 [Myxococcales bacterium]|nr:MAG: hypothetical protein EOO73_19435 [Myxococcales bacterium]
MRVSRSALVAIVAIGCAEHQPRALPAREPFIALERDFQDFERWNEVDLSKRPAVAEAHTSGEPHEWVSHLPPPGSKVFPVGTIFVKTVKSSHAEATAPEATQARDDIFAMVKRGGGYNPKGAPGWEWFELRRREDDSLGIVWRGVNPPSGEGYGGDPLGGCNGCHQMASKNDYVHAAALAISER